MKNIEAILSEGESYLDRDTIIEFLQNEGHIRYDEIVRKDLSLSDRFNEMAYKKYLRTAKISDVLDRESDKSSKK